ncbi:hypothetical protein ElyMa_005970900 [Elysia marginata]|uniref:Uncharacterized protein n=1 Tax=Elysia marginata TaxID=1093978 RepID=A0AAV4GFQ6_9GAST|nr:hypothetical protein ElyMa_005970900 [Elysia marginata]
MTVSVVLLMGVSCSKSLTPDFKENAFNRQDQRTPRTFLDPISEVAEKKLAWFHQKYQRRTLNILWPDYVLIEKN